MSKLINISLDRELWDGLTVFAGEQTILQGKRFPVIEGLRMAIKVFMRLEVKEINEALERDTRNVG